MILLPAIDLYGGQAVRLYKGNYAEMTVYSGDPASVAEDFARCGARWIHVVDLEGARDGGTPNFDTVRAIKARSGLSCEIGGGVRDMDTLRRYLDAGLDRVILGTAAVTDRPFLTEAARQYGEKLAVGVDIRDGRVAVKGWLEDSGLTALDFCRELQELGIRTLIVTDISRDGAMRGANRELYRAMKERLSLNIVASGGVSSLEDLLALSGMGLYGAIVGKAYYTGAIDLKKAIEATA